MLPARYDDDDDDDDDDDTSVFVHFKSDKQVCMLLPNFECL